MTNVNIFILSIRLVISSKQHQGSSVESIFSKPILSGINYITSLNFLLRKPCINRWIILLQINIRLTGQQLPGLFHLLFLNIGTTLSFCLASASSPDELFYLLQRTVLHKQQKCHCHRWHFLYENLESIFKKPEASKSINIRSLLPNF